MPINYALPPGPSWPLIQTLRFGVDPYGFLMDVHRQYGDVFTLRAMGQTCVMLADPATIRELYAHGPDEVDAGATNQSLRPLIGSSNVSLYDGEQHLARRRLLLPPFHGERMRAYEEIIREIASDSVTSWPLGEPVAVLPRMEQVAFRVILRAVFGLDEPARLERVGAPLRRLLGWASDPRRLFVFAILGPERLMRLRGYRRVMDDIDRELLGEITRRRAVGDLAEREDVLSLLLSARDDAGDGLTDRELRDELVTLLMAGHATTATTLSWALFALAGLPEAQERLAAHEPGLADAAISETLRLWPPTRASSVRRLRGPLKVAGWDLPAGTDVAVSGILVGRRDDVYDDPLAWRVDRFLDDRPPASAWLPFGGGVRRCIGAAFAQFEARSVLDELLGTLVFARGPRSRRPTDGGLNVGPPAGGKLVASRAPISGR